MTNVVAIGAGDRFSCALRSGGAAFCWGTNGFGALGDGTTTSSTVPVAVTGGLTFAQLVVGDAHACGLTNTGTAYCWGSNRAGELGAGLPIGGGIFSTVPVAVLGGKQFNTMDAGLSGTCGVATDGITYCWGGGAFGQLGNGGFSNSNVPVPVTGSLSLGFQVVSTGFFTTCALTSVGDVWCWGVDLGQFGNGSTIVISPTPVPAASGMTLAAIDAGTLYNCGLDAGGAAFCWGFQNMAGQQGNGTVSPSNSPLPVVGGLSFTFLNAHSRNSTLEHTCGITTSGDTHCWGSDEFGQLGAPTKEDCAFFAIFDFDCSTSPLKVRGHRQFTSVAVGIRHTCGVAVDGRAFCWGQNNNGQLGDGTVQDKQVPVPVRGP